MSDPGACRSVAARHTSWNIEPSPRCMNACIYMSYRSRGGFTSPAMHDPSLLIVMVSTSRAHAYTAEHSLRTASCPLRRTSSLRSVLSPLSLLALGPGILTASAPSFGTDLLYDRLRHVDGPTLRTGAEPSFVFT